MNLKSKIIEDIKDGKSLRQVSIGYNVPLSTVAHWCKDEKIKSKHNPYPIKATDEQILAQISKNKIMTVTELENKFGYHSNALCRRIKNLLKKQKINYAILPGGGGKTSAIFKGYIDKRLYYVKKQDLESWIKNQLPKHIPGSLKKAITSRLRDSGINVEFEKTDKKAFVIDTKLYAKIKQKASKDGLTISEYLRKATHD